jgi:hypothetical protein
LAFSVLRVPVACFDFLGVVLPERSYRVAAIVGHSFDRNRHHHVDNLGRGHVGALAGGLEPLQLVESPIERALKTRLMTTKSQHPVTAITSKCISEIFLVVEKDGLNLNQAPEPPCGRDDFIRQHELKLPDGREFDAEALAEGNEIRLALTLD